MKRGYKKLLAFEILIFVVLVLNSFVWNILSTYKMSIFLLVVLLIFKGVFGFEKDKNRYFKDLIMEVIIFLMLFFILYYLFGVVISFYRPGNYLNFNGIIKFIVPTVVYVILREYARYMFMCKAEGSKILFVTTVIMFVFLDITTAIYFRNFSSNYTIFLFIALTFLPAVSSNFVLSYYTLRTGYVPLMIYSIIVNIYQYLLPIVPNPSQYLASVINFLLPILFGYALYRFFLKEHKRDIDKNYRNKHIMPLVLSGIVVMILVYFTSGYFHLWAIAVASGSMHPKINKGDVVIIEKIDDNFDSIDKGQVIAFRHDNVIVVHRVIDKIKSDNKFYFYTKGDFNSKEDNFAIEEKEVIGVVNHKISYIGIPTVWLNELL